MSGILYVVATPIGNLEDITLRALKVLRDVSLIAAEDTRRTARLLQHYSISTPTTSLHEHNEHARTAPLVARLLRGESVALVSDAGTPIISDPGHILVAAARAADIRVEGIPGPTAVMAALSIAGLGASEFTFLGFPPSRSNERKRWVERVAKEPRLVVFFEAPHRIRQTLEAIALVTGPERLIGIARELTKVHEEFVIRPISRVLMDVSRPIGEYTVLLPPLVLVKQPTTSKPTADQLQTEFCGMTNNAAMKPRAAMKILADRHQLSVNEVYKTLATFRRSVK